MSTALIFGEYKFERFLRVLTDASITDVLVYSAVEFDPIAEFPWATSVRVRPMSLDWEVSDVLHVLETERPDVAIANPYAHGQEQLPTVYGRAAAQWPGRFVTHPPEFAEVACDKVRLHEIAQARGWPVPRGAVCRDSDAVVAASRELGFPLVVKESQSQAGDGRYHVANLDELGVVLAHGLAFPTIVQCVKQGVEAGIELVTVADRTTRWPVVSMGPVDTQLDPSLRARVGPYLLPERAAVRLDEFLDDVQQTFRPFGPWQVDFAVVDDDDIVVFEINPRLGGLSDMGLTATGVDPHVVFTAAALGAPLPGDQMQPTAVTLELPSTELPGVDVPAHPERARVMQVTARRPTNRCFAGTDRMQLITTIGEPAAGRRWVENVNAAGLLRCSPESVSHQLDLGFDALARAVVS